MGWGGGESADWQGRFAVVRKLGSGAMGTVYLVFDRLQERHVAVKTLETQGGRQLYRFKREFRSLAGVAHPNLVDLYELHTSGDEWFFTMELIDGVMFSTYVRPPDKSSGDPIPRDPPLDLPRLREALYQLTDGVLGLHAAGKLHRDLKPANVLVEESGRVVLLDFGLTVDAATAMVDQTHRISAVGTPLYMSPEQAADRPLTAASDWYSIGVMLYEALAGACPFEEQELASDLLHLKQLRDPPPPSALDPEAPKDLVELCMALLARKPAERATGKTILATLGREPSAATLELQSQRRSKPFVGRADELAALERAYDDSRERPVMVRVVGPSGIGKSALISRFLELALPPDVLVLAGRCYERESVPYKALDELIDSLSRYLSRFSASRISELVGDDAGPLRSLFPVLKRVPGLDAPRAFGQRSRGDVRERRRDGFAALRRLIGRICAERDVVLFVDDVQWGDVESSVFFADLVTESTAPPVLLVLCCRVDEMPAALSSALEDVPDETTRILELRPLELAESVELLAALDRSGTPPDELERLAAEVAGNPMLIDEVARGGKANVQMTLDEILGARIAALSPPERDLLEACAIAGQPVSLAMATSVAGVDAGGGLITRLRTARLLRERQADGRRLIEPFHDRVRQVCASRVDRPRREAIHRRLALAYEDSEHAPLETLVEHWLGAGDRAKVVHYARRAAIAAERTCAFHRAADYYNLALAHVEVEAERRELVRQCGDALVNAGRLDEAIEMLGRAADDAEGDERLELRRRQVEQLLRRGRVDDALRRARELFAAAGVWLPSGRGAATASLLYHRLRLRLRGPAFRLRPGPLPDDVARRLNLLWSFASAFGHLDPMRGQALQAQFVREALDAGDRGNLVRALSIELAYLALDGDEQAPSIQRQYHQALDLAREVKDDRLLGRVETGMGVALVLQGRWLAAEERLAEGERLLAANTTDSRWELDLAQIMRTTAWRFLGSIGTLRRVVPLWLKEARERGDAYLVRGLQGTRANLIWLASDHPEEALRRVRAVQTSRVHGFHTHHFYELITRVNIALYQDRGDAAHQEVEEAWRQIVRARLLRPQLAAAEAWYLRGRAALLAPRPPLALVERCAQSLEARGAAWSRPLALSLRAGVALARDRVDSCVRLLERAAGGFEARSMAMHLAAARYFLGGLVGGDEGADLERSAIAAMNAEGVTRPDRFAAVHLAGLAADRP